MGTLFTPSGANRTLPLVKRIVGDILDRGAELRALLARRSGQEHDRRMREIEHELRDLMRELKRIGCFYKDWGFETGLVDFPARIDGREVYLCWRSDEERITWYHDIEAGFQGRQPIPQGLLEER
jgi:hypothetical protein